MTKDELVRVLASTRTDLNKARLIILAAPGGLDDEILRERGADIERHQEYALEALKEAVEAVNDMVLDLGDIGI